MSRITRKLQKIFALSASNNGQFGSGKTGAKVTSNDLDTIQNLSAWGTGWLDAIISAQDLPPLEEMQSTNYVNTYQLAYLFQEGIPEWETGTTYYQYSIVKKSTTYQIYGSLTDNNTGNSLTDPTKWVLLLDFSAAASTNTTSSVVNEIALFADTAGRILKRAVITGLAKLTSGVLSAATDGTDYLSPTTAAPYTSTAQTITASGSLTLTHGLGAIPRFMNIQLQCLTAEGGYSIGDIAQAVMDVNNTGGSMSWPAVKYTSTQAIMKYGASPFTITNFSTTAAFVITPANWKAIFSFTLR